MCVTTVRIKVVRAALIAIHALLESTSTSLDRHLALPAPRVLTVTALVLPPAMTASLARTILELRLPCATCVTLELICLIMELRRVFLVLLVHTQRVWVQHRVLLVGLAQPTLLQERQLAITAAVATTLPALVTLRASSAPLVLIPMEPPMRCALHVLLVLVHLLMRPPCVRLALLVLPIPAPVPYTAHRAVQEHIPMTLVSLLATTARLAHTTTILVQLHAPIAQLDNITWAQAIQAVLTVLQVRSTQGLPRLCVMTARLESTSPQQDQPLIVMNVFLARLCRDLEQPVATHAARALT